MRRRVRSAALAIALLALGGTAAGAARHDAGTSARAAAASGKVLSGFEGTVDYDFGAIAGGTCTFDVVRARGARIVDHVVVTPDARAVDFDLSFNGAAARQDGYVRIEVCNPGRRSIDPPTLGFAWLVVRSGR